jgi:hypothetical protein
VTEHVVSWFLIVLAVTGCVAALSPHTNRVGLVKDWVIFFAEVCLFGGLLAIVGKTLHDFLFQN